MCNEGGSDVRSVNTNFTLLGANFSLKPWVNNHHQQTPYIYIFVYIETPQEHYYENHWWELSKTGSYKIDFISLIEWFKPVENKCDKRMRNFAFHITVYSNIAIWNALIPKIRAFWPQHWSHRNPSIYMDSLTHSRPSDSRDRTVRFQADITCKISFYCKDFSPLRIWLRVTCDTIFE